MDAGPEIRRCVCAVERRHQPRTEIISRHNDGAQIMSVRPEGTDNQKNGHSRKQEGTCPEIVILILEEEVDYDHCHISEPQQVRDDKRFTEGNEIIRAEMNQPIVACHGFLQMGKPQHIYDSVEGKRQRMSVLLPDSYKFLFRIHNSMFLFSISLIDWGGFLC